MKRRERTGFTVVELMIVVIIIGIMSAIAAPAIMEHRKNTVLGEAPRQTLNIFETARARSLMRNAAMRIVIQTGSSPSNPGSIVLHESTSTSCNDFPTSAGANPVRWSLMDLDLTHSHYAQHDVYMSLLGIGNASYGTGGRVLTGTFGYTEMDLCLNRRGVLLIRTGGTFAQPSWQRIYLGADSSQNQIVIGFQRQDKGVDTGVERVVVVKQGAVARIMR